LVTMGEGFYNGVVDLTVMDGDYRLERVGIGRSQETALLVRRGLI